MRFMFSLKMKFCLFYYFQRAHSPILLCLIFIFIFFEACTSTMCEDSVHAFHYLWYDIPNANTSNQSGYKHWDHEILPHWGGEEVNRLYPSVGTRHAPEAGVLHSPFFPLNGPYSSADRETILRQIDEAKDAGIGALIVSWWGQATKSYATDSQGVNTDRVFEVLLQVASEQFDHVKQSGCQLKIGVHLEPYPGRSVESIAEDLKYIIDKYAHYPAFLRDDATNRPLFYVYDSYHIPPDQWSRLLRSPTNSDVANALSIRGDPTYDSLFIGLWLDWHHGEDLSSSGFDGAYTYFASDGFSFGSTSSNWRSICSFCERHEMRCSLSVGPGYDDSAIRPWNAHTRKDRRS